MSTRYLRSITHVKEIQRALPHSDLNVRIARLAVLFEDLRIEMYAIAERGKIAACDHIGDGYRRLYFVRRAIATVLEIRGGFQRLDQCPEFQDVLRAFTPQEKADWRGAVAFLVNNEGQFRQVRNDVGGHFLEQTADYALSEVSPSAVGVITIKSGSKPQTAGPFLKFAEEIVAVAITRHKGTEDAIKYYHRIIKLLMEALGHITRQLHILTHHYLWERFA